MCPWTCQFNLTRYLDYMVQPAIPSQCLPHSRVTPYLPLTLQSPCSKVSTSHTQAVYPHLSCVHSRSEAAAPMAGLKTFEPTACLLREMRINTCCARLCLQVGADATSAQRQPPSTPTAALSTSAPTVCLLRETRNTCCASGYVCRWEQTLLALRDSHQAPQRQPQIPAPRAYPSQRNTIMLCLWLCL